MAENSQIQWTEHTWNPWHGCTKISPGCKFCYMYRDKERYGQDPTPVLRSKSKFRDPLKWKEPARVFTCSWSDWFIEDADEWRDEAWQIIKDTPHLTYQILTKRPGNIARRLPADWGDGYPNVWLGVSIESTDYMWRMYVLARIKSQTRFISFEPLLDRIYFTKQDKEILRDYYHWSILGGESGNESGYYKYRPSQLVWYYDLIQDLPRKNAVFVKQLGTHLAKEMKLKDSHGGNIDEWPEDLRVREFPQLGKLGAVL